MLNGMGSGNQKSNQQGQEQQTQSKDEPKRVLLEEKYFRKVKEFTGDAEEFKTWMFKLQVAIGQIDERLARIENSQNRTEHIAGVLHSMVRWPEQNQEPEPEPD